MSVDNAKQQRASRLGMAWSNLLELFREGRISEPYGTPFVTPVARGMYSLRHYALPSAAPTATPSATTTAPILLVPPLMVTAEVYDISSDTSAVRALQTQGVDVWLLDFGSPDQEPDGVRRTLDDHVRAVSRAIDDVVAATGRPVHVAGYSQGGMFCYQAAAWRKCKDIASVIAFGSPVDWHQTLPNVSPAVTDKLLGGLQTLLSGPLAKLSKMPGAVMAGGFKLVSAKKEVGQLVDFVSKLHDREALARREARRLFLGGDGFISWPGPALRAFIDELVVANRMSAGGIVLDGDVVTLSDLTCPILYVVGLHDEIARPQTVRAISAAAPGNRNIYEAVVPSGHFGIVVGRVAQTQTWPQVAKWMRWVANTATPAPTEFRRADTPIPATPSSTSETAIGDLLHKTARVLTAKVADAGADFGNYLEHARWQVPRLSALAMLRDDTVISIGKSLAEQGAQHPDQTLFLWAGRAVSYGQADARVNLVASALAAHQVGQGDMVGIWMNSRPSLLMTIVALSRLGATAVILPPTLTPPQCSVAAELVGMRAVVVDPEHDATAREVFANVIQVRSLTPSHQPTPASAPSFAGPSNPGVARDLALVFVRDTPDGTLRTAHVTNRRWAFSALGAASACLLTRRDTVYCCLPLHHPSGLLVAASAALVGGARLALAPAFTPQQLLSDARRFGVTVVFYAGDMCRALVDRPRNSDEHSLHIRLFAGSGMPHDVWQRMKLRFRAGIVEFYGASEASVVLVNTSGEKIGSVGRPLPGSASVEIATYDLAAHQLVRGADGHITTAPPGMPGLLIAKLEGNDWQALATRTPDRVIKDALAFGDHWYDTREIATRDEDGDVFILGRKRNMVDTPSGWTQRPAVQGSRKGTHDRS